VKRKTFVLPRFWDIIFREIECTSLIPVLTYAVANSSPLMFVLKLKMLIMHSNRFSNSLSQTCMLKFHTKMITGMRKILTVLTMLPVKHRAKICTKNWSKYVRKHNIQVTAKLQQNWRKCTNLPHATAKQKWLTNLADQTVIVVSVATELTILLSVTVC
jgi:hypothetical protein